MDPLSAISLASAVVQFVDFGSRLLRETVNVYKSSSGRSVTNNELRAISNDLSILSNDVILKSTISKVKQGGGSEEVFVRLCHECSEIGKELHSSVTVVDEYVNSHSKPKRAMGSFLSVLSENWSAERIAMLRTRLDQLQQRMVTAVLVFLW